ncbi:MAG: uncharacterized protein K0S96_2184, partial [Geminicoccaceae bacterium]|nr:uncharacterized protein [Geminicoccaceae bacterium]
DGAISERWHLLTEMSSASAVNFLIGGESGFKVHVPGAEPAAFRAGIALEARPDALTGLSYDLSLLRGTGIQFGLIRLEAAFKEEAAQVRMTVRDGALTLSPKAFDNFLGRLLPGDGLRLGFDFAFGHASDRGSFLEGQAPSIGTGAARPRPPAPAPAPPGMPPPLPPLPNPGSQAPGLSLSIPIGKSLGPVTIHDLRVGVGKTGSEADTTYLGEVTTSVSAKLGPVLARVERVGLHLAVRLPAEDDSAANLGLFDLDIAPRPPDGVALAIDAKGVVTGGGFLFHDRAQALYAGVMQLTLRERITLKAFGLLATRLPDGSPGYSLIVFITAEDFRPYPLGMGFMLRGIGGMLAVNRTFDEAAMREGLKNNTLANLLFPRDPIRRAPEILASLATVFPARIGSYLFGPLARITWGTPVMVVLDLALILEFGNRTRLIVLGRVSSILPSRENDLVRLNMDALGLIDFDEGRAEFDAVLVDSRLAHKFVLTGAMAMRMRWTSGPGTGFALAVGGLNPHFAPPAGFPKLDRVTINLASGDNPRITCAAYIAITSNTLQFGAHATLFASAHGFSVEGDVGFDVLIQLLPFHFLAEFHASIQLKRGTRNLFKVAVQGALEGPRPLRVSAKATFEILWCDFSVRFDKTLVSGERPPLPPAVDALAELRRALADTSSWSAQMPGGERQTVVLRKLAPGGGALPALHPLGRLSVRQSLLPLNTARDIDTFGGAPVRGDRRFAVTAVTLNGDAQTPSTLPDLFAPAQFFDLTEEEKLASPSFETMDGGLAFGSEAIEFAANESVDAPLVYEAIVIDPAGAPGPTKSDYALPPDRLAFLARLGAVAAAPVRTSGAARFRHADAVP